MDENKLTVEAVLVLCRFCIVPVYLNIGVI